MAVAHKGQGVALPGPNRRNDLCLGSSRAFQIRSIRDRLPPQCGYLAETKIETRSGKRRREKETFQEVPSSLAPGPFQRRRRRLSEPLYGLDRILPRLRRRQYAAFGG